MRRHHAAGCRTAPQAWEAISGLAVRTLRREKIRVGLSWEGEQDSEARYSSQSMALSSSGDSDSAWRHGP